MTNSIACSSNENSAACAIVRRLPYAVRTPALFLDRDGVLIEECHYLSDPNHVRLIDGAAGAIAAARAVGWAVVVVTNQAGIGRGYYSFEDYLRVEQRVAEALAALNVETDAVFACPYHPEGVGEFRRNHVWRKPGPGMILAAANALNIDLDRSWMVGDRISDLEAGAAAGIQVGALVETGYGRTEIANLGRPSLGTMRIHRLRSISDLSTLLQQSA